MQNDRLRSERASRPALCRWIAALVCACGLVSHLRPALAGEAVDGLCLDGLCLDGDLTLLQAGLALPLSFDASRRCQVFSLPASEGFSRRLRVSELTEGAAISLWFRLAEEATIEHFDARATGLPGVETELLLPESLDASGFLTVLLEAGPADVSALVGFQPEADLVVDDIDPEFTGAYGTTRNHEGLHARVTGSGFSSETTFELVQSGAEGAADLHIPAQAMFVDAQTVDLVVNLSEAPLGAYDLVALDPIRGRATLVNGFAVRDSRASALRVTLRGPITYRERDTQVVILQYANSGSQEIPAPLLRIRSRSLGRRIGLRIVGSDDALASELYVLGIGERGLPDILSPMERGQVLIQMGTTLRCDGPDPIPDCELDLQVDLFTPETSGFIDWSRMPNPDPQLLSREEWTRLRVPLSARLGRTWSEFVSRLGWRARRIARRQGTAHSAADVFGYTVREASREDIAAVLGRLVAADLGAPVVGAQIVAFSLEGEVLATGRSRANGRWGLGGLPAGAEVSIAVDGRVVTASDRGEVVDGRLRLQLPQDDFSIEGSGDVTGVPLETDPGGEVLDVEPLRPDILRVPRHFPSLPNALFTPVSFWRLQVVSSTDPNDKTGCVGPGDLRVAGVAGEPVDPDALRPTVDYTIRFENSRCVLGAAKEVTILDRLDSSVFDLETLRLGAVSIGRDSPDKTIPMTQDLWGTWYASYTLTDVLVVGDFPLEPDDLPEECSEVPDGVDPAELECDGEIPDGVDIDPDSLVNIGNVQVDVTLSELADEPGIFLLRWDISSCRRGCRPHEGFLPPNDCATGQGEGYVTFSIQPMPGLDDLTNVASIVFDGDTVEARSVQADVSLSADEAPEPAAFPIPGDNAGGALPPVPNDVALRWTGDAQATMFALSVWRVDGETRVPVVEALELFEAVWIPVEPWQADSDYEWSVVTFTGELETPSPLWHFRTQGDLPDAPQIDIEVLDPPDGSLVDDEALELAWRLVEGSDQPSTYTVYLWTGADRSEHPAGHTGLATHFEPYELETGETYSWQVLAVTAGGEAPGPVSTFTVLGSSVEFERGDANSDGNFDLSDAVSILEFLFLGADRPDCPDAADVDDSGEADISDAIAALQFLFVGGAEPPAPFGACGEDPTKDALGCAAAVCE